MSDTTTIEITVDQKANLDGLKDHSRESYKSVLDRLISCWEGETEIDRQQTIDVEDARLLSQHVERGMAPYFEDIEQSQTVDLEATTINEIAESAGEPQGVVDSELYEKLDRIERAAKEATNAAQSADRKLENMGGR